MVSKLETGGNALQGPNIPEKRFSPVELSVLQETGVPRCITEHDWTNEIGIFDAITRETYARFQQAVLHEEQHIHVRNGKMVGGISPTPENPDVNETRVFYENAGLLPALIMLAGGSPRTTNELVHPELVMYRKQQRQQEVIQAARASEGKQVIPLYPLVDEETQRKTDTFLNLYEHDFDRVTRYIAKRIGSIDEAEDLASEVFTRGLKVIDSYKDRGAPMEAWLFKIARNIVIDYLRERGRKPHPVEINEALTVTDRRDANPDDQIEYIEEVEALYSAMEKLSYAQRQTLSLRLGAGMTSKETAEVMGKKEGAVRQMKSASVAKLREIMQETS